ncbi:hypothetical protein SPRG_11258 [Saprolegnia parasitica CBS 223.65]|uniref:RecF/RecN/SMC N-terminal domain-containing protein n=1 Tax=Saprolegnia parasitica (strain CBS 223.65) TaxID=695850 RepID=A0A067CBC3_SAPPC|nr:hypothetical protein SPRG_11258 [Saprolegnia parasitica CBS 223.65]KDO23826.1 hypothetical protein SPRG_11258 [Saprolegnia parasitica CBS 223.65]|eukprot:XP_012205459.1 hypothetical protein SPRG_11258 [Saprolegnia parasitica CBS 223.65]
MTGTVEELREIATGPRGRPPFMQLNELHVTNFKSFRGSHAVAFSPGVNCITGPNGAGKSNLLEAICFAMGSSVLATFRVKQWKDLLNCAEKEASIKLTLTTASTSSHPQGCEEEYMGLGQGQASVGVTLAPSGHRVYYVNNRAKAKKGALNSGDDRP